MSRRIYHWAWYWQNAGRRRKAAREGKQRRYWARWLLRELAGEWHQ